MRACVVCEGGHALLKVNEAVSIAVDGLQKVMQLLVGWLLGLQL